MTSLLMNQWLDACVLVPADDFTIITKLAAKAANEGQVIEDLSELRRYALNTHVDDAEASLVQSLQEKHRAIDAAARHRRCIARAATAAARRVETTGRSWPRPDGPRPRPYPAAQTSR